MNPYRICIEVDITARNSGHADQRARLLYSDLGQRPWVLAVLPDGIEERQWINPRKDML